MAVCPYIMAGNTVKFDPSDRTEDIANHGGFAPTSRHTVVRAARQNRPGTPGRRAATPGRRAGAGADQTTSDTSAEAAGTDTESTSCSHASSRSISPVTVDAHPSVHPAQVPVRANSMSLTATRVTFANPIDTTIVYDDSKEIGVQ